MAPQNMQELWDTVAPLAARYGVERVYLFGSYAYGTPTEDSDFDFYIVVDDSQTDTLELMARAYSACSEIKQHPVDILVGTNSKFESRKQRPTIESEVYNKGVLLYGA